MPRKQMIWVESAGALVVLVISIGFLIGSLRALEAVVAHLSPSSRQPAVPNWFWVSIAVYGFLVAVVLVWYGYRIYRWQQEQYETTRRIQERQVAAVESAAERLRERMALPSLLDLNNALLTRYHGIATEQAQSSFRSSRRAMWCGFGWLLVCFTAGVFLPTTARIQVLLGSLAVTGGALSAFLGRTYIRVYERSLQQLNSYFDQPLLNSYLLSAERIIGEMDQQHRDQAYQAVIDRLLEGSKRDTTVDDRAAKSQRARVYMSHRSSLSSDGTSSDVGEGSSDIVNDRKLAQ